MTVCEQLSCERGRERQARGPLTLTCCVKHDFVFLNVSYDYARCPVGHESGRSPRSKVVEREPVRSDDARGPGRTTEPRSRRRSPTQRERCFRVDFEARLMSMISEAVRSEVNRALGERAKPPVEVAGADVFGALSNSGLRNLPTEGGRPGETTRKRQAPVKAPRQWPRASSTPWDIGAMTGLPCGTLQLYSYSVK
ncbi:unnamed protein product, partial [Trichogramma brassicae]